MKKAVKFFSCIMLPVIVLVSSSCSGGGSGSGSLAVAGVSTSVGQGTGTTDTQIVNYSATILNMSPNTVYIEFVAPVPSAGLEPKILSDNLSRGVSKNILSGQTIDVKGSVPFDARGMTKEQIDALAPFITGFHVIYEETLPVKK